MEEALLKCTGIPAKNHSHLPQEGPERRSSYHLPGVVTCIVPTTPRAPPLTIVTPRALLSVGTGSLGLPQLGFCWMRQAKSPPLCAALLSLESEGVALGMFQVHDFCLRQSKLHRNTPGNVLHSPRWTISSTCH